MHKLSGLLFKEDGFCGNQHNYYDYRNSLLDHVLHSRTGIPISLSVLFAAICRRVGVHLDMIGLPGHFLLATRTEPRIFVDAFHGGATYGLQQVRTQTLTLARTGCAADVLSSSLKECKWRVREVGVAGCGKR